MYTLQLRCTNCGYHTYVSPDGIDLTDELFGDELNSDWDAICTCNECKTLFQRRNIDGKTENKCRFCGSEDITVNDKDQPLACPVCGQESLENDYSAVSHYF